MLNWAADAGVHALDGGGEVADQMLGFPELQCGRAVEELVEHVPQLYLGEEAPQAEVRAATTERDVGVRLSGDVELPGIGECLLVPVTGRVEHDDPVALADLLSIARNPDAASRTSSWIASSWTPWTEQKISGFVLTSRIRSFVMTAQ